MTDQELLIMNGGLKISMGGATVYDFGFRPGEEDWDSILDQTGEDDGINIQGPRVILTDYARSLNEGKHPLYNWQLTGSCFPSGVPVRMADGKEKNIEKIRKGDFVKSHTGETREVIDTMNRNYNGNLYKVFIKNYPFPISSTDDHPFAVWRKESRIKGESKRKGKLIFVKAKDLKEGDELIISGKIKPDGPDVIDSSIAIPFSEYTRNDKFEKRSNEAELDKELRIGIKRTRFNNYIYRNIKVDEKLARLIGLYLAEGGCTDGCIIFTFSAKEIHYAEEVVELINNCFGVKAKIINYKSRPSVCTVKCINKTLALFFKHIIPGNVYTKRVPEFLINANKKIRESVLKGWIDGDGSVKISKDNSLRVVGVSVCRDLIRDMHYIAVSLGINCSVQIRPSRKQSKESYQLLMTGVKIAKFVGLSTENVRNLRNNKCKYGKLCKITKIEKIAVTNLKVYDLTVDIDHSFVANSLVVHNCVNGGGQNALTTRIGVEVALLPQAERFAIPFTLLAYGKSRYNSGWNREGEGSIGSEFAKELGRIGVLPIDDTRLPKYHACGPALVYDRAVELSYSAVKNHPPGLAQDSVKYTTKYVRVKNSNDAVTQLRKGRPITWCGDWGGLTQVPLEQGYRLNRHATTWNHQQSCVGFAEDTPFGLLFLIVNQWYFPTSECKVEMSRGFITRILQAGEAKSIHGDVDKDLPACSYWVKPKDMDYQCSQNECMALYDVLGFGGQVGPTA